MIIFKRTSDLQKFSGQKALNHAQTGFIPTMGALHPGHISLISESVKKDQLTICSIFVNPVQFNDPKDYQKYPVTIEKDIRLLEQSGCDVLFLPAVTEIYPGGARQDKQYDLGYLETVLEGRFRPGHFQAVCMVMDKLLDIVRPGHLYLGQKDYQQCMVIKKLLGQLSPDQPIEVKVCNTLREPDGLAMSSRNMRLNQEERKKAPAIYKALQYMNAQLAPGDLQSLKEKAGNILLENGFKPDYVELAEAANLRLVSNWDGKTKLVGIIAAFLNDVRLIDNLLLN